MLRLHPAWHHLAPPCPGADNIPKGGAPGLCVPLCAGTVTCSHPAVPMATPAAAGGRVHLSRGFLLVLASGAGIGAAGSAMVPGQGWQLLASLVTWVVWPQHSLQGQLWWLQSCLAGDTGGRTAG